MSIKSDAYYQIYPETNKQLLFLHQDGTNNIRFAKREQFNVGYYVILLYSAILFISRYSNETKGIWFIMMLGAVGLVGIVVIWKLQIWIKTLRGNIFEVEKKMSPDYKNIISREEAYTSLFYRSEITLLLTCVLIAGLGISVWLLERLQAVSSCSPV